MYRSFEKNIVYSTGRIYFLFRFSKYNDSIWKIEVTVSIYSNRLLILEKKRRKTRIQKRMEWHVFFEKVVPSLIILIQ